jgi:hypothetical protein
MIVGLCSGMTEGSQDLCAEDIFELPAARAGSQNHR